MERFFVQASAGKNLNKKSFMRFENFKPEFCLVSV
jgi:hypothetical protein